MPVTFYSSSDAGAPAQLPNAAGGLIAVLDACLVSGYGSKPAAGWSKEFSGTNLAVYKQGDGGNGFRLRVDDALGGLARVRGFETMTGVSAGAGPFPTDAQVSGGGYLHKHDGGGGSRKWFVIANERALYFWTNWNTDISGADAGLTFFGDIKSRMAGDQFHAMLMAGRGGTKNSAHGPGCDDFGGQWSALDSAVPGHFFARSFMQVGGSVAAGKRAESHRMLRGQYSQIGSYGAWFFNPFLAAVFPSAVDGGIYLAPIVVHEPSGKEDRGTMPGLWLIEHRSSLQPGDTFSAGSSGYHAGKNFVALPVFGAIYALETSDTW